MLRGIRKASSNWLGKAIMAAVVAFLVVSFAIWGIGDIFRGFGLSKVATIGHVEISMEQFRQAYNEKLQQLGRQIGRPITTDQARALGLDRQVLGQMVAEAALDQRAQQMGLQIADSEIAQQITKDSTFFGPNGQFDHSRFEYMIRQAGFTETRYVDEQRRVTVRRQLANTVTGDLTIPKTALDVVNRYQNEQRSIEYVTLGSAQAGEIATPTPEELSKYYDEHKIEFRAPEYRKAMVMVLSPEELGKWQTVSDADARKSYDEHKARYTTPERRHVRQIVFPNEEEAKAARERITSGTAFGAIAAERKLKDQDIDLGTVPKNGIIDTAVANAAFSLKTNEVSQPVKGQFGVALVQTLSIEPEKVQPFEEVAPAIKHDIAMERGKADMANLRDKVEDELAAGSTLAEVAKKLNLAASSVEVDRSGRGPDSNPVQVPGGQQVLSALFSTDVGVQADPVQSGETLTYYDVNGVTPSRERKLDEVKTQVEQRWRNEQIAAKLKTLATEMTGKLKAGTSLQDQATAAGLKVETADGLTRTHPTEAVSAAALAAIFDTPKDGNGSVESQAPDQMVFRVTKVTVPPLDANSPDAKKISEQLNRSVADAMLGEYLTRVEADIGTSINQSAVVQALGTGSQQQ
jgi:peptidyl-prolyl cis-trans isomerase D